MAPSFLQALASPEKYAEWVPIERCTVAGVIDEDKVFKFVKLLMRGKTFKPLVGVLNPFGSNIAIADGHHRFEAFKRIGHDKVLMAVSVDPAWYPIVAFGVNQLTLGWQKKARRQFRKMKCWMLGREDWGV
jgi:uncharacterized protein (DUF1015 family)